MTKIKHPTIDHIRMNVPSSTVGDWLAMKWLLVDPTPTTDPPARTPTPLTAGFKPQEASTS